MNMLLEQFKNVFDRPEKVKKLRELILQLAVRGKLVEQDENDEPASVLLERITEEKEKFIKEGKIKKEKPLLKIGEDEMPYELPKGWEWVRLKDIGYSLGQKKPDKTFTYIDIGSINNKLGTLGEEDNIIEASDAPSRARKIVDLGTIIYSTVRPYLLNIAIIDKNFEFEPIVSTAFAVIHPYTGINNKFVCNYLRSETFIKYVEKQMVGMAYPAINDEKFFKGIMPIAPINEQKRIVEKVESLMLLCDNLEKELQRKVKYSSLSSKSVFNSIGNCDSLKKLEEELRFIIENLKELTLSDGGVKELKSAILQLAVQGKLISQDPEDEPVSVLLERIKEEKERLVKEGKIKKEKPLPEISEDEKLYELPAGWKWIRWINVLSGSKYCMKRGPFGSALKKEFFVPKSAETYKVYEQKNAIYDNAGIGSYYITKDKYEELRAFKLSAKDLIISCSGVTLGRIAEIPEDFEKGIINQALLKIELNSNIISNEYFIKLFRSQYMQQKIFDKAKGSAIPNMVGVNELKNIIMPLPPFSEQKRIVEKVNSLMVLCDELEKRIENSKKYSEKLMEAILKDTFTQM